MIYLISVQRFKKGAKFLVKNKLFHQTFTIINHIFDELEYCERGASLII